MSNNRDPQTRNRISKCSNQSMPSSAASYRGPRHTSAGRPDEGDVPGVRQNRTLSNWKFWIFSTIIQGLFDTYNNMVSTASIDELCRTTLAWLDQHCSLVVLRPAVLNALRQLSTTTSILSDPSRMPEHATEAVLKTDKSTGS